MVRQKKNLRHPTQKLAKQWQVYQGLGTLDNFSGVSLMEMTNLENCFSINIEIFEYDENQVLCPKLRSRCRFRETMYLLLFQNHFMYIANIDGAGHSFACSKCSKLWPAVRQLNRHEKGCNGGKPVERFKGGVYNTQKTIWEFLASYGIDVDTTFVYPFRATYDFESFFLPLPVTLNR